MFRALTTPLAILALSSLAAAQPLTGTAADHDALRALKDEALRAVNAKDYAALKALLHQPFMATVVTQDSFTDFDAMKTYFESLFTRPALAIRDVSFSAEADDFSTVFTGTIALTRGGDVERYEMADGRAFDIKGRWTAVSVRQDDGQWKLAAIHMGTDFLDNPVLAAIEKSVLRVGAGGAAAGLVAGLAGGILIGRRRKAAA